MLEVLSRGGRIGRSSCDDAFLLWFFSFSFSTFLLFLSFPDQRDNMGLLISLGDFWILNYILRSDRSESFSGSILEEKDRCD